jgi:hypothetical protein
MRDGTPTASPVEPLYLEFVLGFVIERSSITEPYAHRRLNGFENALTALAARYRPALPLVPDRELRMSNETREALLGWIEAEEAGKGFTLKRLAVYAMAVTDDSVPEGWVRLNLRSRN